MKNVILKQTALCLVASILFSSCASTTMIHSTPGDAKLYLDSEPVGSTPYRMKDTKIVGSCTNVRIEKEGYESLSTEICRDEEVDAGAVIGGIFFLFPFLWTMKYKPTHTYELTPLSSVQERENVDFEKSKAMSTSKADQLRELKKLYDEGVLTKEEYEKEKKKVLEM